MIVKTGFGYYIKNGKKTDKYELPLGEHPDPIGYTVVEVANQQELDKIILDKSDAQILFEQAQIQRENLKKVARAKLNLLGLKDEEVNALIGL